MKKTNTKNRITAFIMSLLILAAIGLCSFPTVSYADTTLNFEGIKDAQYDNWDSLPEDFKAVGQAYFNYFSGKGGSNILESASKIPMAWFKVLKDGTPVISPLGQLFYYLDGGELFVEDTSSDGHHTTTPGRHRAGDTNPVIPAESFVTAINNNTTVLTTSLPTSTVSWKNNPLAASGYDYIRTDKNLLVMQAGKWFGMSKDLYAMPFVVKNGITYYGDSVYHFYYGDYSASISKNEVSFTNYPMIDVYSSFSSTSESSSTLFLLPTVSNYTFWSSSDFPWDDAYLVPRGFTYSSKYYLGDKQWFLSGLNSSFPHVELKLCNINSNYIYDSSDYSLSNEFFNASNMSEVSSLSNLNSKFSVLVGDDETKTTTLSSVFSAGSSVYSTKDIDNRLFLRVNDVPHDYGFLVCSKRFEIGALMSYLDGSRIPQNSYITISGDSVYDYSITNVDTGEKMNFGDFYNNGYAWINTGSGTQNNGGGSGSGGGVGGNVTVGGDVNVGGKVDIGGSVDINVNVNGGGNGQNPNDYIDPGSGVDTSLGNYLQYVPEVSKGFIDYLKDFFAWLPLPIYGLLILGLIVAIFCRLTGR